MSTDCFCRKVAKQWPFNPGIVFRLPLRRVLLLWFTSDIILANECLRNLRFGSYTSEITFLNFLPQFSVNSFSPFPPYVQPIS